ncbi:MarR family winged helix-turn-helix transcriptional regulator [Nocardioides houyundeii]|uniref:MarR family winged helix-turn-helix transcriptional regulator n=1 Tax=Nocardioides houyundeii TaxID=2045452 RepID=UPI000C790375|nr:MarR family transcriptional regulator [Nocardioides houyundeii]
MAEGAEESFDAARAPGWDQTGSLLALRQVLAESARMGNVVARRAGLSHRELTALEHLSREPLGPAELARRLDVTTAAATGIVDRLAERGHVERHAHAEDRRRTEVRVTDSGRGEAVGHLMPMFVALDRLDRSFSADERAVVERYLRGVLEAFDAVITADRPGSPPGPPR